MRSHVSFTENQIAQRRILAKITDPLARKVMENSFKRYGSQQHMGIPHLYFPKTNAYKIVREPVPVSLRCQIAAQIKTENLCKAVDRVEALKRRLVR